MAVSMLPKLKLAAGLLAAASPLLSSAAAAQSAPSSEYDRGYQAGRAEAARADQSGDYTQAAPQQPGYDDRDGRPVSQQDGYGDAPPPPGYDGNQMPPPPPGYQPQSGYAANDPQDRRYEAYAEDWAQRYCVRSTGNTAGGAVIGGLLGALVGSSVAGRHNNGAGALMGGIAGAAVGGAAGAAQDNATSPGCPPGYVTRGGSPTFAYQDFGTPYYYAAPGWYRPWIFVGGRWNYRPYPYHAYYYGRYYRGGYGRGGYGHRH